MSANSVPIILTDEELMEDIELLAIFVLHLYREAEFEGSFTFQMFRDGLKDFTSYHAKQVPWKEIARKKRKELKAKDPVLLKSLKSTLDRTG